MHEISIAQNIIEIIHQHVPQEDLNRVVAVRLDIGSIAGVVPDSLEFSFQVLTIDTPLTRSRLEINRIPFQIVCNKCRAVSTDEYGEIDCDNCGSTDTKVLSGTELKVVDIEISEMVQEIQ